jgi:transcriptional regulator with XRE-family HTH domain
MIDDMGQGYAQLGKASRGLVQRYIEKMTGLSRAQVTRLITGYMASGRVQNTASANLSIPVPCLYNRFMQFLSLSRRRTDAFSPEAFTPELAAREGLRVKELYAASLLRQIWRRGDIPGAAILWEAANEAEVRAALDSLPIAQAGMLEILAVVPLAPYPGFGPA